ncbi:putative lipoprotein [Geobacillus kaustophilus]|uniref:Putative lipoprotein n=1 Tax=Geobacillus kaustophilus TaxID=1462 RepID=A0A0D8C6Y8_GEOKU|nr:putative lipoprotein [Geobacillus kaustophilus]
MRKTWLALLLLFALVLSACGNTANNNKENNTSPGEKKTRNDYVSIGKRTGGSAD